MLYFKKLRWKNFLSYGNVFTEIDLACSKSTLLRGANGQGKSVFLDALFFVLYNKAFRAINKPDLVNTITKKDCLVEVELSANGHEYLIRRGINKAVFEIYQDGKLISQDAASKDYQETLESNILKMNSKSFGQVVVLGLANYTPFMSLTAGDRRKVIEDLLDIQIFSVMNSLLKEYITENKNAISSKSYEIQLIEQKIEADDRRIQDLKKNNDGLIEKVKEKISQYEDSNKNLTDQLEVLKEELAELKKNEVDVSVLRTKFVEINKLQAQMKAQSQSLNKKIEFYQDNSSCPTCKQSIDEDFKQKTISTNVETLEKIETSLETLLSKADKVTNAIEEGERKNTLVSKKNSDISLTNSKIQQNNRVIKDCLNEIKNLEKKTEDYQDNSEREALERSLDETTNVLAQLLQDKEVLSIASALLKDGGIKSRIVKQYIPVINSLLNKYLTALDFCVQFELDENFNETIKARYMEDRVYSSFSQGEKLRIDLAILFAFRAMAKLRNSTNCNLLILDEILDGSLDSNGVEDFMQMISQLTSDTNTFIISHKDNMADKFNRVIHIHKEGNFSQLMVV